jgi:hypothetical protein
MIETVRKVLGNLKAEFPQYDGQGCELAGFVWFQGWNDVINKDYTAEYESNMVCFIKDLRKDLKAPDLPVVIAVMGIGGKKDPGENILALRKAQNAAGAHPDLKGNVACVQTADYWDDEVRQDGLPAPVPLPRQRQDTVAHRLRLRRGPENPGQVAARNAQSVDGAWGHDILCHRTRFDLEAAWRAYLIPTVTIISGTITARMPA